MNSDRSVEPTLNVLLAELLRNQGLDASAERRSTIHSKSHQPDLVVARMEDCIAIECEFAPAKTVQLDAVSRLGSPSHPIIWHGLPIQLALAVIYPLSLREVSDGNLKEALASRSDLAFRLATPARDGQITWGSDNQGSVRDIADVLTSHWVRPGEDERIDQIVANLDAAISMAAEILSRAPAGSNTELNEISSEPERVMALIWANAMVFHELLASTSKDRRIPIPNNDMSVDELLQQWSEILRINYWPIFHTATEALKNIPANLARLTIDSLRPAVRSIAESGMASRHDWAGRVFHRLLENRKLLATNYTTIPSAILLAHLALGSNKLNLDESTASGWGRLRIVDPCCGTGTLLMAVFQEAVMLHRRKAGISYGEALDNLFVPMMEEVLHGYDVVPSAVHLTAATLAMSDPNRVIQRNALWIMPHTVEHGRGRNICRLGTLDFLSRSKVGQGPTTLSLFSAAGIEDAADTKVGAKGSQKSSGSMPNADLIIMNPPYTRAGGPGKRGNTEWNPIFGSVLSKEDVALMQKELGRRNSGTAASILAGLGSSFVVLADEIIKQNGIIAFVLPAGVATGSSWAEVRKVLFQKYRIDWVITSHDPRTRPGRGDLPGRNFVSFSESTRMSEVLIVGQKTHVIPRDHSVKFANLRKNVDHPIASLSVGRALISLAETKQTAVAVEILSGSEFWGEVISEPQRVHVDGSRWTANAYIQHTLHEITQTLVRESCLRIPDGPELGIPITKLSAIAKLGPYHLQIKGKQAPYRIIETDDPTRGGRPAIWHHQSNKVTSIEGKADSVLQTLTGKTSAADRLWEQRSRLHITEELRHAPQRVAAVWSKQAMLGVRAWKSISLLPQEKGDDHLRIDQERALALWFNSTLGLLTRIPYSNRPYLGRTGLPSDVLVDLPILDVSRVAASRLKATRSIWDELSKRDLMGFADIPDDSVRKRLNFRLITEVLGGSSEMAAGVDKIGERLSAEPVVYVRA
jgi:hypothetical protein